MYKVIDSKKKGTCDNELSNYHTNRHMKKKLIAFYLPQFHRIPENDEWWGEGFTEWVNTKKARPLFPGHDQPKTPLNENYYCLLDEDTQIWQANLAKQYGIYGFCYYHYWFNGKLLLEKPLENMLKNSKVDIPFCFSWANETWARTWDGREKSILIKQEYGGEKDWEEHFQYLLAFFKDPRYIKIAGKPLLLLYSASRIEHCEEMVEYWKKRICEEGFPGLFIAETLNGYQRDHALNNSSADVVFEPIYSLMYDLKKNDIFSKISRYLNSRLGVGRVKKIDGKKVYKIIQKRKYLKDREIFAGTFPRWDNTARKGNRGVIFEGTDPDDFRDNLSKICQREDLGEFVFINAWNEWGEGAYLEPDQKSKYSYLEACQSVINIE